MLQLLIAARCYVGARNKSILIFQTVDEIILIKLRGWRQRMLQLQHGAMLGPVKHQKHNPYNFPHKLAGDTTLSRP